MEIAELQRVIHVAATQVLGDLPKFTKGELAGWCLQSVGASIEGMDDKLAMLMLSKAWGEYSRVPKTKYWSYGRSSILGVVARIDPNLSLQWAKRVPRSQLADADWQPIRTRELVDSIAYRRPLEAASFLLQARKKGPSDLLLQTVRDLFALRTDIGIGFLKMIGSEDRNEVLPSVGESLNEDDAKVLLGAFSKEGLRHSSTGWKVDHEGAANAKPDEAPSQIPYVDKHVTDALEQIDKFFESDRGLAGQSADHLCDEAMGKGPGPFHEADGIGLKDQWQLVLLPGIAKADTPKVRNYLEHCQTDYLRKHPMRLAIAWSYLDLNRGEALVDEAIKIDPESQYGAHRRGLDSRYFEFLKRLAVSKPVKVARQLDGLSVSTGMREPRFEPAYSYGVDIIRSLWQTHPMQARQFCAENTDWSRGSQANLSHAVDILELDKQALDDPIHSELILKKLSNMDWMARLLLLDGPDSTAQTVVAEVSRTDVPRAIELSSIIADPRDRMTLLLNVFEARKQLPFAKRSRMLQESLELALSIQDPENRSVCMGIIAEKAKLAWQRLQPWPPASH